MQWKQIAKNWDRMKVVARERWTKLSDRDVDLVEGDRGELLVMLEERYGWDRERADREIRSWQESDQRPLSLNRPESLHRVT